MWIGVALMCSIYTGECAAYGFEENDRILEFESQQECLDYGVSREVQHALSLRMGEDLGVPPFPNHSRVRCVRADEKL